jgi:hypothetical protein
MFNATYRRKELGKRMNERQRQSKENKISIGIRLIDEKWDGFKGSCCNISRSIGNSKTVMREATDRRMEDAKKHLPIIHCSTFSHSVIFWRLARIRTSFNALTRKYNRVRTSATAISRCSIFITLFSDRITQFMSEIPTILTDVSEFPLTLIHIS